MTTMNRKKKHTTQKFTHKKKENRQIVSCVALAVRKRQANNRDNFGNDAHQRKMVQNST